MNCEDNEHNGGWVQIADVEDMVSHSGDTEPT